MMISRYGRIAAICAAALGVLSGCNSAPPPTTKADTAANAAPPEIKAQSDAMANERTAASNRKREMMGRRNGGGKP